MNLLNLKNKLVSKERDVHEGEEAFSQNEAGNHNQLGPISVSRQFLENNELKSLSMPRSRFLYYKNALFMFFSR
jgi:hypothetical protein